MSHGCKRSLDVNVDVVTSRGLSRTLRGRDAAPTQRVQTYRVLHVNDTILYKYFSLHLTRGHYHPRRFSREEENAMESYDESSRGGSVAYVNRRTTFALRATLAANGSHSRAIPAPRLTSVAQIL